MAIKIPLDSYTAIKKKIQQPCCIYYSGVASCMNGDNAYGGHLYIQDRRPAISNTPPKL